VNGLVVELLEQLLLGQLQMLQVLQELVVTVVNDSARVKQLTAQVMATTQSLRRAMEKNNLKGEMKMANGTTGIPSIDNLVAAVAAEDTVIASAITLINGIAGMISTAIAAALAGGATAAQLSALTAVATDVTAQAAAISAAVVANTPASAKKP
jgi:hypothetical protein